MNDKKGKANVFARIFITLFGIVLILLSINEVGLLLFGKTAKVMDVYTSRVGGRESNRPSESEYKWSVSWTFMVDGKEYDGRASVRGSSYSVRTGDTIYYYPFAPQINSMYAEGSLRIWTLVQIAVGILLIVAVNLKPKKKGQFAGKDIKQSEAELHSYDDSIEEVFHND